MDDFIFIKADKPAWPSSSNVFAIRDDEGFILIEVGCGNKRAIKKLYKKFNDLNLNLKDVHTVVISHSHPDHMGAISTIFKEINPKILINEIEKKYSLKNSLLNKSFDMDIVNEYKKEEYDLIDGHFKNLCTMSEIPEGSDITTFKDNDIIELGRYKFRTLTTPGHAPGHTAFYEINKKFLLSGDVIGERGYAWFSPSGGGLLGYYESLEKIEKLSIDYAIPSHGLRVDNVKKRIDDIRLKFKKIEQSVLHDLDEKSQTFNYLVDNNFPPAFADFPGTVMITSCLDKLEKDGQIERTGNIIKRVVS